MLPLLREREALLRERRGAKSLARYVDAALF